jgi:hypothetical protein
MLMPLVASAPARAAEFDGRWSVLVITEKGDCDPGYRYEVMVGQGQVNYAGDAAIGMDGTIAPNGNVKVSVGRHGEHTTGIGRLSSNAGVGTWRSDACAGRWEAERR